MRRLNTCARMLIRCTLGSARAKDLLPAVERYLLDNHDEASVREVARSFGVPESSLRQAVAVVRRELKEACLAEKVDPKQLLAVTDDSQDGVGGVDG